MVSDAERIASLETRISAHERAIERAEVQAASALERAETVLTKRFEASNEIREAMRDQSKQYVTRQEFQWSVGTIILVLVGLIIKLLTG